MNKGNIYIVGFTGIIAMITGYFLFMLFPSVYQLQKSRKEALQGTRSLNMASEQLKSMNQLQIESQLVELRKSVSSFTSRKVDQNEIPLLLNTIAKIAEKPRIKIYLKAIKQGQIMKNEKVSAVAIEESPVQSFSQASPGDAPPPPPPPSGGGSPPPPQSAVAEVTRTFVLKTKGLNEKKQKITWEELPIYVDLSAEMIDIAKFFYYLNQLDSVIVLDNLTLKSDMMNTGTIDCKVKLLVVLGETHE
ncbi:MAG: hypothetical protein PHQ23_12540 [Candidatus Wallbacteria bacterium]|nr:hypothetical protein [Candidatus Wallbacteria bacterium]